MIRLFIAETLGLNALVNLTENQVHYLLHVMRQKKGNEVALFNGRDGEWLGIIEELDKKQGRVRADHQTRKQTAEKQLILCPAVIKKENMDWVLQKATELGVSEIVPLMTERTVVGKLNRLRAQSIVTEAAEQCERLSVPVVREPVRLKDLWQNLPPKVRVICAAERIQKTDVPNGDFIPAICVGPEGGWTDKELAEFECRKAVFWHFGQTILRAETASVVALVCAQK